MSEGWLLIYLQENQNVLHKIYIVSSEFPNLEKGP